MSGHSAENEELANRPQSDAHVSQTAENDAHAGCREAWEHQQRRADFAEARLDALVTELRSLAHAMDGIQGHKPHPRLEGKTLGGAVRNIADGKAAPRPTPPGSQRGADA